MSRSTSRIQRAILSVTDKTGLVDFARQLSSLGIELISTGGTAKLLRDSGIAVKDISELTGFPEMLDGRVKTLHPKVHGGILHRRENPAHVAAVAEHGIQPIDMVVVNLYAFEKTAAKPGVAFEELIENIDIGGPSMIRSAAKNFHDVAVVTSPADYPAIAEELASSQGALSLETKWRLAQKAFATTAAYDSAIASTLERIPDANNFVPSAAAELRSAGQPGAAVPTFPKTLRLSFQKTLDLRYGENPHQKAAMYSDGSGLGVANARQLQGKELSYNNIVDLQAAWDLAQEFDPSLDPNAAAVCAIIKHTNPAGSCDRQDSCRSLQARPRMRSRLRIRRRDRREPPHRRRSRRRNAQTLPGSDRRPRFRRSRQSPLRQQEKSPPGRSESRAAEDGFSRTSPAESSCKTMTRVLCKMSTSKL